MEDVLEVYHRPYDPTRPVVCMDETFKQLIGEVARAAAAGAGPGRAVRQRVRPQRRGQPVPGLRAAGRLAAGGGHRHRKRVDWAHFVRELVDGRYTEAEKIVLVMDQLNTRTPRRACTRRSRPERGQAARRQAGDPPHAQGWSVRKGQILPDPARPVGSGRSAGRGQELTARCPRLAAPFREGLVLSEWAMKRQQWVVRRQPVGHPTAQRRWDRAYQLLLQATVAPAGPPAAPAAPRDVAEESRHASSRLRQGLEPKPSSGADH